MHFNVELYTVADCDQCFATTVLKVEQLLGPFLTLITKTWPKNHAELLARANKLILVEDMHVARKELRVLIEPKLLKNEPREEKKRPRSLDKQVRRRTDTYTRLNPCPRFWISLRGGKISNCQNGSKEILNRGIKPSIVIFTRTISIQMMSTKL